MKYKVGDKVKIREDLQRMRYYMEGGESSSNASIEMIKHAGEVVTIKNITHTTRRYILEECSFYWTDGMFEGLAEESKNIKEKIKDMKNFKIVDYKVYNNKALNVTFEDNLGNKTEEKAVCNEADKFDLERGLEVCVLKYVLGEDTYKQIIREAGRQIKAIDKAAEDKKALDEMIARKKAKNARRKAARQEKARQDRIDEMKEAYLAALTEYTITNIQAVYQDIDIDDLK